MGDTIRVLVAYDLDLPSSARLVESCITGTDSWDLCCALGPFTRQQEGRPPPAPEARVGEMTAILAQLENIVCRLIYVPAWGDPIMRACAAAWREKIQAPRLTTSSKCLHGQRIGLLPGLAAAGFAMEEGSDMSVDALDSSEEEWESLARTVVSALCTSTDSMILITPPGSGERGKSWMPDLESLAPYRENAILHLFADGTDEPRRCDSRLLLPLRSLRGCGSFYTVVLKRQKEKWEVDAAREGLIEMPDDDMWVVT
jgi:hypothetical protein